MKQKLLGQNFKNNMINNNFTKYKIYKSIFTIFVFLLKQINYKNNENENEN